MTERAIAADFESGLRAAFQTGYTLLRDACVTQAIVGASGDAVFLVSGGDPGQGRKRGAAGLATPSALEASDDGSSIRLSDLLVVLKKVDWNIFTATAEERTKVQAKIVSLFNRQIDGKIIAALDAADPGDRVSCQFTDDLLKDAKQRLRAREVSFDDVPNMFALVSPAARAFLIKRPWFASGAYVTVETAAGLRQFWRAGNINWIISRNLIGLGTSAERSYLFHRFAIGDAVNAAMLRVKIAIANGNSEFEAYLPHVATLLQPAGVARFHHDGTHYNWNTDPEGDSP